MPLLETSEVFARLLIPPWITLFAVWLAIVPLLSMALMEFSVPELAMVAPALFVMLVDVSDRPVETLTPAALVELLVRVVMPLKLPLLTLSWAVPLLSKVLLTANAPPTLNVPVPLLAIAPLI